jgi:hypothetical protein
MPSTKIGYKGKPYYGGYILNPPKNGDRHVLSSYTGSHASSVRDFGSITPLFSDHILIISVTENNGVMVPQRGYGAKTTYERYIRASVTR